MSVTAGSIPQARGRSRLRAVAPIGWLGLAIVGVVAGAAITAPWISPYDVHELSGLPLEPPSSAHPLGTNGVGQDVLSQVLEGARVSLLIALLAGTGSLVVGASVGMLAGWIGGWVDTVAMRIVDFFLVIPRLPLLIVVAAYAGTSLWAVAAIIVFTTWPPGARIIRSQVLSLRPRAHLRAAVGFGASSLYVVRRHLIPELGLILAAGLVAAAERAVVLEAGLSFLGLGDVLRKSWGSVIRDALAFESLFFTDAWSWWLLPPVLALALLLLGLTFVGLSVEQRVNPRVARHAGGAR